MAKKKTQVGSDDSSPKYELSEDTVGKFKEFQDSIENREPEVFDDGELMDESGDDGEDYKSTADIRNSDEGLNPDGTIVDDEPHKEDVQQKDGSDKIDTAGENVEDDSTDQPGDDLSLPNRLVQAGKRSGLSDEDIRALGPNAETVLGKMADNLDAISAQLGELGRLKKQGEKAGQDSGFSKSESDDVEGEEETRLEKIERTLETLAQSLQGQNKGSEVSDSKIDSFFDKHAESYPQLGDSKSLAPQQEKTRQEIWGIADNIMTGGNVPLDEALERAFSLFESSVNQAGGSITEQAKKRSKQRISKPSHRETRKEFKNPDDKAKENYMSRLRELGLEGSMGAL